jgi:hypothetical protein
MTRTKRSKLIFGRAFQLKGVDRLLPAGQYELVSDEELIEGLSFPAYRRVASWIMAPSKGCASEMLTVDPGDVAAAHERDLALSASAEAKG